MRAVRQSQNNQQLVRHERTCYLFIIIDNLVLDLRRHSCPIILSYYHYWRAIKHKCIRPSQRLRWVSLPSSLSFSYFTSLIVIYSYYDDIVPSSNYHDTHCILFIRISRGLCLYRLAWERRTRVSREV